MRLLGLNFSVSRDVAVRRDTAPVRMAPPNSGGAWSVIFDGCTRLFQRDVHVNPDTVFAQTTFFSCATQIASDVSKIGVELVSLTQSPRAGVRGIAVPIDSPAFSPLLRKPNRYQTWQQFIEHWVLSKILRGNMVCLKERDDRGVVIRLHVLNYRLTQPLVDPLGRVFYRLWPDDLAGVRADDDVEDYPTVPASEIIHDRYNTLFHPLVGLSPVYACGVAAMQAHHISTQSARFFQNQSRPGGLLLVPGKISEQLAERIKADWQKNYTGDNAGRVAVLSDGVTYEGASVDPVDAQLVEQLKLTAQQIAATMHVPGFLVGVSELPSLSNIGALLTVYYTLCLQVFIEAIESCMDEGIGVGPAAGRLPETKAMGVRLNLRNLLRMDAKTMAETHGILVQRGLESLDEGRADFDLPPVAGGKLPYLQQQNWSVEALAAREANGATPPAGGAAGPAGAGVGDEPAAGDDNEPPAADGRAVQTLARVELARQAREAHREAQDAIDRARRAEDALAEQRSASALASMAAAIAAQLATDDADDAALDDAD